MPRRMSEKQKRPAGAAMAGPSTRTTTSIRDTLGVSDWQAQTGPDRAAAVFPHNGFERLARYGICQQISAGGMASVHLGFSLGSNGFSRFVAIKRMRPELACDASLVARFKQEVLLGARIQHPNVVQALDVVSRQGELLLVMEFIHGVNFAGLLQAAEQQGAPLPIEVALHVVASALHGLHAAHEATDECDVPLALVHRDFSPQNVLIGSDGYARILDFGIAKTLTQAIQTEVGALAGKLPYMAPEQLRRQAVDRRTDVFAAGVVLWEALVGKRLFGSTQPNSPATMLEVLGGAIVAPSQLQTGIPHSVDTAVLRALRRDPNERFASAREFALALEATGLVCGQTTAADCVRKLCAVRLAWLDLQQDIASRALALNRPSVASEADLEPAPSSTASAAQTAAGLETIAQPRALGRSHATPRLAVVAALLVLFVFGSGLIWRTLPSKPLPLAATGQVTAQPAAPTKTVLSDSPTAQRITADDDRVEVAAQAPLPTPSSFVPPRQPQPLPRAPAARTASKPVMKGSPASCSPPTYLDARGIRHFKEQCL
jgi:serine/threonine protein kinase